MSGVQATLALVLLRYCKRGGKLLRLWFAKRVLLDVNRCALQQAHEHHLLLYLTRIERNYWERYDMRVDAYHAVETCHRHRDNIQPLRRVAYFSHMHEATLVKWRRISAPALENFYVLLPAPQRNRRSARLSMKRNARKRVKLH